MKSLVEVPRVIADAVGLESHPWDREGPGDRRRAVRLRRASDDDQRKLDAIKAWGAGPEALENLNAIMECADPRRDEAPAAGRRAPAVRPRRRPARGAPAGRRPQRGSAGPARGDRGPVLGPRARGAGRRRERHRLAEELARIEEQMRTLGYLRGGVQELRQPADQARRAAGALTRPWWRWRFHEFGEGAILHRPDWVLRPPSDGGRRGDVLIFHGAWLSVERVGVGGHGAGHPDRRRRRASGPTARSAPRSRSSSRTTSCSARSARSSTRTTRSSGASRACCRGRSPRARCGSAAARGSVSAWRSCAASDIGERCIIGANSVVRGRDPRQLDRRGGAGAGRRHHRAGVASNVSTAIHGATRRHGGCSRARRRRTR